MSTLQAVVLTLIAWAVLPYAVVGLMSVLKPASVVVRYRYKQWYTERERRAGQQGKRTCGYDRPESDLDLPPVERDFSNQVQVVCQRTATYWRKYRGVEFRCEQHARDDRGSSGNWEWRVLAERTPIVRRKVVLTDEDR